MTMTVKLPKRTADPTVPDLGPDRARAGEEGSGLRRRARDDGRWRAHGGTQGDRREV